MFIECLHYIKDCDRCLVYVGEQNRQISALAWLSPMGGRWELYENKEVDCIICDKLISDIGERKAEQGRRIWE